METEKLYYADPFLRKFTATVLSCEADKTGFLVVLDRTAFYPEGGGQPADQGVLGEARVLDVHEKNGVVFHICDKPVEKGTAVTGAIDWARRFDHMQQHSGEHILSGILCRDCHCDNVGFHMGAETVTIDYNTDITWEQAMAAEEKANEMIWADGTVEVSYPSPVELKALDYRSKKELTGQVRIVTFPGADCCACCGTHVLRAGQVGLVKVLSVQKFREGVRMEILCGGRALRFLSTVWDQNRIVAQALSVKPEKTAKAVERTLCELHNVKLRAAELEEAANLALAKEYAGQGDVLLIRPSMAPDAVRRLADAVAKESGGLAAVFAGEGGLGHLCKYSYALVQPGDKDIGPLVKALNSALHGRGGGRNGFAQGSAETRREEIEAFWAHRDS